MPYIKSTDREILDAVVERLANDAAGRILSNLSLIAVYKSVFIRVAESLHPLIRGSIVIKKSIEAELAQAIYDVGAEYDYEGAYLGELNYALTRFIQRVPQLKVQKGVWTQELRYWLYAATVEALIYASYETRGFGIGVSGVFEDIKDEYKRRVNVSYEAEQILKNGDCYDAPYYTRLIEVIDENGTFVGYQEIMLKRDNTTLNLDLLNFQIVVRKKQ